jgi:hypothetical protein
MIKLREKGLHALLLAILLHVGVFSIFYLNIDKNVNEDAKRKTSSVEQSTKISESEAYPPLKTQAYTMLLDKDKMPAEDITDTRNPSNSSGYNKLTTSDNQIPNSKKQNDHSLSSSKDSEITVVQTLRKDNLISKDTSVNEDIATSPNNDELVESAIKNVGLLAGDTATQNTTVKMDKEYQAIKNEVDDTNSKLSDFISEVKKRNQQKIDNIQQQQQIPSSHNE